MAEVDRRSRAILNSLQAARDERAAVAQEERNFMTSFNPNTAAREDFTRFRENLRKQAYEAINTEPGQGIMGAAKGNLFHELYTKPYQKMMGTYMRTNPESYQSHFPFAFAMQKAIPMATSGLISLVSGLPGIGPMIANQQQKRNKSMLGNFNYLNYRPNRLMNFPEGFAFDDGNEALLELIESTDPYEANYRQFFPMEVPDYFYQFMDDEMLPFKLGME